MFTGIIQEVGSLKKKVNRGDKYQLTVEANKVTKDLTRGESVAVNGTCLTVVEFDEHSFTADVMPETVESTNLDHLKRGAPVNLELPVTVDEFFGGHLVAGHVDGRGVINDITVQKNARLLQITIPQKLEKYLVDKGSVAVDGISLTIAELGADFFVVSLIPETWENTNLYYYSRGDEVNVETDLIGKYVVKTAEKFNKKGEERSELSRDFLQQNGFL